MPTAWKKCSSCKDDISCGSEYFVCSVSTCNQKRTNYAFCSVECWDQHIPIERHRSENISAIAKKAPLSPEAEVASRRIVVSHKGVQAPKSDAVARTSMDSEILVVASKLKKFIHEKSQMNTSASTMEAMSDVIRKVAEKAIENARRDGRKTVMDRDIPRIFFEN